MYINMFGKYCGNEINTTRAARINCDMNFTAIAEHVKLNFYVIWDYDYGIRRAQKAYRCGPWCVRNS